MKRIFVFLMAAILVGGLAFSAQAVTVLDPSNGEMHLYQIVADPAFGGLTGYANSQAFANAYPIVQTLSGNSVGGQVDAYAKFASFTERSGIYAMGNPGSAAFDGVKQGNGIFNGLVLAFANWANPGFADQLNTGQGGQYTIYTQPALNQGGLANGLIFQISPNHFIVAFEDGGGVGSLGDKDYNDLVLNVTTSAVPIPGAVLLLGSGLLGLVGMGWRKRA